MNNILKFNNFWILNVFIFIEFRNFIIVWTKNVDQTQYGIVFSLKYDFSPAFGGCI